MYSDDNFSNNLRSKLPWVLFAILVVAIAVLSYFVFFDKSEQETVPEKAGKVETITPKKAETKPEDNYVFEDGLKNPNAVTEQELDDLGEGVSVTEVYLIDINKDGKKDRVIKSRYETGTAHFYFEYTIGLNKDNVFIDITPSDFRTVEGADCSLQKFKFTFIPTFQVIKISRNWEETWNTPTTASKTIYKMVGDELKATDRTDLKSICNVSDLFN